MICIYTGDRNAAKKKKSNRRKREKNEKKIFSRLDSSYNEMMIQLDLKVSTREQANQITRFPWTLKTHHPPRGPLISSYIPT